MVTFASEVSCVTPEMIACSMVSSPSLTMVPSLIVEARTAVDDHAVVAGELDRAQLQNARTGCRHLEHLLVGDRRSCVPRERRADRPCRRHRHRCSISQTSAPIPAAMAAAVVSEPPRPSVVMWPSSVMPWKPAMMTM
jgi:hypothetical protein